MLGRLARWCTEHRRLVVVAWLAAVAVTVLGSRTIGGDWRTDYSTPGSDSERAAALLAERFPEHAGDIAYVVYHADSGVNDPVVAARIDAIDASVESLDHVAGVAVESVSPDARTAIHAVQLDDLAERLPVDSLTRVIDVARDGEGDGLTVEVGGWPVQNAEANSGGSSEGIGMLAAIVILLLAFGSVIAAGLPLVTALPALVASVSISAVVANVLEVPEFGTTLATMIGLGVGVDYALFIVTRHRDALHAGATAEQAIVTAMTTAGRAVLFAGGTVVISMLGLGTMGQEYLWGAAVATSLAVLGVVIASCTLLPALLGFAGTKIDRLHVPRLLRRSKNERGAWERWSGEVQRRPIIVGGLALLVLIVLAAPITGLHYGFPDAGTGPESLTSRRAYDLVAESFGPGANGPLVVVLHGASGSDGLDDAVRSFRDAVEGKPSVAAVSPATVNAGGDTAVISVVPTTGPQDNETESLLRDLRDNVVPTLQRDTPVEIDIGGSTAAFVDMSDHQGGRMPWFVAAVVLVSFVLLVAVFRAPLVALKAAVMNLLSIAAAYGVIALATQGGWFGSLIGIHERVPVPTFVPILMFAMLFGLSMDYEVFLLSEVREEYMRTGDNRAAVARGIARTGRVITAAAAIMVTVFAAFILEDVVFMKLAGIGLATAVLVDATVIRMALVPATMELLGDRNWWIPRWLDRLVPHLDVHGTHHVLFPARSCGAPAPQLRARTRQALYPDRG